ncbi:MAG: 1-deoxy-D-xylulose-5-phosphate synthase, partial [Bacteroidetes bacterium]|nr:1-deoxy-D-xylulose-5-phosphate synthase [Bacteroidota bacterium]
GNGVMTEWKTPFREIKVGTGRKVTNGNDVAILTIGHPGNFAQESIAELNELGVSVAHYDMRFVKPIDEMMLHEVFTKFKKVITIEDGCIMGGFGSAVLEFMVDQGYSAQVVRLGIPDEYIHHGTQEELWEDCGFDAKAIVGKVKTLLAIKEVDKKLAQKLG